MQYFDLLFNILYEVEVLPLLAGYFYRAVLSIMNNKYKETIDRLYSKPQSVYKMLDHCYHMPIAGVVQMTINLDVNKSSTSIPYLKDKETNG